MKACELQRRCPDRNCSSLTFCNLRAATWVHACASMSPSDVTGAHCSLSRALSVCTSMHFRYIHVRAGQSQQGSGISLDGIADQRWVRVDVLLPSSARCTHLTRLELVTTLCRRLCRQARAPSTGLPRAYANWRASSFHGRGTNANYTRRYHLLGWASSSSALAYASWHDAFRVALCPWYNLECLAYKLPLTCTAITDEAPRSWLSAVT